MHRPLLSQIPEHHAAEKNPVVKEESGELCRICESMENLVDISKEEFRHLNEKLHKIANFAGNFSYLLNFICTPCSVKLENAFDFKVQCENTYKILICRIGTHRYDPLFTDPLSENKGNSFGNVQVKTEEPEDDQNEKYFNIFEVNDCPRDSDSEEETNINVDLNHEKEIKHSDRRKSKKIAKYKRRVPENTEFEIDEKRRFVCAICGQRFAEKWILRNHIQGLHVTEKPYLCNICDARFSLEAALRRHKAVHKDEHIPCDKCGKIFKTLGYMKKHLKQVHSKPPKPNAGTLICQTCGHKSKNRNTLTAHLRIHTTVLPHECEVCKKKFLRKQQLDLHQSMHTGEKPFMCHLCSKAFRIKTHLTVHLRSHTGEKNHKCQLCGKSYTQSYGLKLHMQCEHLGEPRYECPKCFTRFRQKKMRTIHAKGCNGEPPKAETTADSNKTPNQPKIDRKDHHSFPDQVTVITKDPIEPELSKTLTSL